MMTAPPRPPAPAADGLTPEQAAAVDRRHGDLLLAAGAGSGKTRVLTERFVRAVLEDDVDPARILAVTFTEKAASELAERIRGALVAAERPELARRADEGWIGTLHSLCARILRSHPLAAGLDPRFVVLDEVVAARLASEAWDTALAGWVREHRGRADELLAAYGAWGLRQAVTGAHGELRSRGVPVELPAPPAVPDVAAAGRAMRTALKQARAAIAAAECPVPAEAGPTLVRCGEELDALEASAWTALPAPLALEALLLPRNGGKVMKEEACLAYREALEALTQSCLDARAVGDLPLLDDLLRQFAGAYAAAKGDHGGLDFADLELGGRDLLRARADVRAGYREQFASIMVDEFQDTNHVQLDLLELLADDNLFTVGDAQQAIYGFRHADVGIFRARRAKLAERGAALRLSVSFRAAPTLLRAINAAFAEELEDFESLRSPDGTAAPADAAPVELLLADLAEEWPADQVAPAGTPPTAPTWRVAEARLLARRVAELVAEGRPRDEIVVLLRATGDLSTYSGALEDEGVATYVIGGRGFWAQHEVQDMVAWLSVVANPRDELRLYEVLASPLVGASADALAALAAAARQTGRDPWAMLVEESGGPIAPAPTTAPGRTPTAHLEDPALDAPTPPPGPSPLTLLDPAERDHLARFADWAVAERAAAAHRSLEELIERALLRAGYDLQILRAPGGPRRLANVRKLMRLAREWEADAGRDLRGFLDLVAERVGEDAAEAREGEAPVEGDGLDAVRLMTIHRAKGLEFPVVCVADLGRRRPNRESELLRLGDDGRVGLRVAVPGGGRARPALAHAALGEELRAREQAEERRLFYVGATRAREHLILSGAVNSGRWPANGAAMAPVAWLAPAFVPGLPERLEAGERSGAAEETGTAWRIVGPEEAGPLVPAAGGAAPAAGAGPVDDLDALAPPLRPPAPLGLEHLSYSALDSHRRCGYRFYLERVLRLPARDEEEPAGAGGPAEGPGLSGLDRGSLVHALLEDVDFAAPAPPGPEALATAATRLGLELHPGDAEDVAGLVAALGRSPLSRRLAAARRVAREERFAFGQGGMLITGVLDALADEGGREALVVDYKTNRLEGRTPAAIVESAYAVQRLVYALAALRAGNTRVDVAFCFLEAPEAPVVERFEAGREAELAARLEELQGAILAGRWPVAPLPDRELCAGCPGRGTLCTHPAADTWRAPTPTPPPADEDEGGGALTLF